MTMGWLVTFDDTTYPEWLRPSREAQKSSKGKKEKIIDRLWQAMLIIKPPEPIPNKLAIQNKPLKPKSDKPAQSQPMLTGSDIRKQREAKGITQTALANWIGKTRAWLCMVEKGKRKISQKEAKELMKGIDFLTINSTQV
jgi:DNA-binding transcriptional regulator YiaG